MAFFKEIWQYTQGDRGFTEVYYSIASTLASAATFPTGLINAAINLRNELTVLRKIRISDVANNRSSVVVNINRSPTVAGDGPDIVSTSAILTLNAPETGARRSLWLRGLDDGQVKRDPITGVDRPTAGLQTAMNTWIRQLANAGYHVQSLKKLGTAPLIYARISSITVSGPGSILLTMPTGFELTTSKRIILSQIDNKLFPGLNGHWAATAVTSNTLTVGYNSHLANSTYLLTKGRSRPEEYQYGPIVASVSGFNKFGSRDTGRSPLGGRGRRGTRLSRSA